jgi:alkylhydroperoxidase/carboxymuconolactone decarboxylase family protein YurZ
MPETLTEKEKALIGLSASVAAGCQPCTEHYVEAARAAGACERGVALAVETALAVRESATRAMDEWAGECQGARPQLDAGFRTEKRLIAALAAVAAAVATNSVPDLKARLADAQEAGATVEQIRAAAAIAAATRRTAGEKLTEAAQEYAAAAPCCQPAESVAVRRGCC